MNTKIYGHSGVTITNSPGYIPYTALPVSATPGSVWCNQEGFHVYTGSSWTKVDESVSVSLEPRILTIVGWAEKKMREEHQESEMLKKYPALKSAKENYDLIKNLVKDI